MIYKPLKQSCKQRQAQGSQNKEGIASDTR